jgi:phospholipid-translocating ATPase
VHVLGGGDGGYTNRNPMEGKAKTFVRGIPLPKRKSKKSKSEEIKANADLLKRGNENDLERIHTIRSQVSTWDNDPEAGDTAKELGWQRTIWEDVKVGDIVKIYDNEPICAGELATWARGSESRRETTCTHQAVCVVVVPRGLCGFPCAR